MQHTKAERDGGANRCRSRRKQEADRRWHVGHAPILVEIGIDMLVAQENLKFIRPECLCVSASDAAKLPNRGDVLKSLLWTSRFGDDAASPLVCALP
jgi:hypothetical protein